MKKVLAVMMVLLLVVGLGAVVQDSASFGIYLDVPAVYEIKVAETSATNVSQFNSAISVPYVELEYQVQQSGTFYVLIKTNDRAGLKVQAKLEHLRAPSVDTMIAYTLKSEDSVVGESQETGLLDVELFDIEANAGSGLRVISVPFLVSLLSGETTNSFELASVGNYATTVIFELTTL